MEFKFIIGLDMAKENFELVMLEEGTKKLQMQVDNNRKSIVAAFRKNKIDFQKTLICMEHTGIYNNHLLSFLHEQKAKVWLENPVHIKRSTGLVRGKNDRIDAMRVATFAHLHQSQAKLWQPKREVIENLKVLMGQRSRLLKAKKALELPIAEAKGFCLKSQIKLMKDACRATLKAIRKDIQQINLQIRQLIKARPSHYQLFHLRSLRKCFLLC